jgi:hypothetical protein
MDHKPLHLTVCAAGHLYIIPLELQSWVTCSDYNCYKMQLAGRKEEPFWRTAITRNCLALTLTHCFHMISQTSSLYNPWHDMMNTFNVMSIRKRAISWRPQETGPQTICIR